MPRAHRVRCPGLAYTALRTSPRSCPSRFGTAKAQPNRRATGRPPSAWGPRCPGSSPLKCMGTANRRRAKAPPLAPPCTRPTAPTASGAPQGRMPLGARRARRPRRRARARLMHDTTVPPRGSSAGAWSLRGHARPPMRPCRAMARILGTRGPLRPNTVVGGPRTPCASATGRRAGAVAGRGGRAPRSHARRGQTRASPVSPPTARASARGRGWVPRA